MLSFVKKHTAGLIIWAMVFIALPGGAILMSHPHIDHPKHLGPQLEYIGTRSEGGCAFPFPVCDNPPAEPIYFYATDMDLSHLKTYFSNAKNVDKVDEAPDSGDSYANFKTTDGNLFFLRIYESSSVGLKNFDLKKTSKKYVIKISDKDYKIAQSAL